jgi:hypothetical protein
VTVASVSGSKCDAVRHYALPFPPATNSQHWPIPNRRHRARSRPKKDTALKEGCAKRATGEEPNIGTLGGSLSHAPALGAVVMTGDGIKLFGYAL